MKLLLTLGVVGRVEIREQLFINRVVTPALIFYRQINLVYYSESHDFNVLTAPLERSKHWVHGAPDGQSRKTNPTRGTEYDNEEKLSVSYNTAFFAGILSPWWHCMGGNLWIISDRARLPGGRSGYAGRGRVGSGRGLWEGLARFVGLFVAGRVSAESADSHWKI